MKLFNTLGRRLEEFKPLDEHAVKLYTCGPTVYDYSHIGNLRAYVFDDTLRRTLEAKGYRVKHVMNITDVGHLVSDDDEGEDKLEKGASRENKSVEEIADHYIQLFLDDTARLNILRPNGYTSKVENYARATDFIDEQIDLVQKLIDKGIGYITEQAIYFDVSRLSDYGKLTGQDLSDKEVAVRAEVVSDPHKKHPQDFALWFFTVGRFEHHSLRWPSPWGEGFPGWHLECSAIIHTALGETIDIHTGGVDHIGTHHTNEIAQTEAGYDKQLSNFWVHNEHLLVDGKKMSKSLGNYTTLKDITNKGYSPIALRLLLLQSHYRSQANFTWESLDSAAAYLRKIEAWADLSFQKPADTPAELLEDIKQAMFDDLNSPKALARLSVVINDQTSAPSRQILENLDKLFGLGLADRQDINDELKQVIKDREAARQSQDWAESDRLRDRLKQAGIEINDSAQGPIWSRI